jgi:NADH-quinone oxidoreductase subunit N
LEADVFDYHALAPELILGGTVLMVLVADLLLPEERKYLAGVLGIVGLAAALFPLFTLGFCDRLGFCSDAGTRGMFADGSGNFSYVVDDFALVLKGLFILIGILSLLLSIPYVEGDRYHRGEYYFLLLASVTGAVVMASSRDLITLFIGLELVSGPAFLLAGWRKGDVRSNEAALKFFLIGVLSAAVLLFGMSLVYGLTGEVTFAGIAAAAGGLGDSAAFAVGVIFMLVGFGFKIAAVPFHFWAPDTYEGAPTPVAAYISVGSKVAGFVGLLTVCYVAFARVTEIWGPVLWVLAAITMTVGNLTALRQSNLVRLLAYSSIGHAGFVLVPLAAAALGNAELGDGLFGSLTYLIVYVFMNLGAFGAVMAAAAKTGSGDIESLGGMATYAPGVAVMLGVSFFSLAGIPPLAGWYAKLVMFRAVLGGGGAWGALLAAIAAVNAVVALFYYARVVKAAFMDPIPKTVNVDDAAERPVSPSLVLALGLTAAVVLAAGFYPQMVGFFGDIGRALVATP